MGPLGRGTREVGTEEAVGPAVGRAVPPAVPYGGPGLGVALVEGVHSPTPPSTPPCSLTDVVGGRDTGVVFVLRGQTLH